MRQVYRRCAGLDVHKKSVVACRVRTKEQGGREQEVRTFGTMTCDWWQLVDWLGEWEVTHVAMESTGEYWKQVYNLLEDNVEVLLVNAQHVKHVPGRKTDVQDAAPNGHPLAELLLHGLLKASFIPAKPQRNLRDLTPGALGARTNLVQERARVVQRVQKILENANIKLASVATDVLGVSGRRMLDALVMGKADAAAIAQLAKGRMRTKLPELQQALTGVIDDHHRFLIAQYLVHLDFLEEQLETVAQQIEQHLTRMPSIPPLPPPAATPPDNNEGVPPLTWQAAIAILDSAPGVDETAAQQVLAEMGINRQQFPSADHLSAWRQRVPAGRGKVAVNAFMNASQQAIANCAPLWCSALGRPAVPKALISPPSIAVSLLAVVRNGPLLLLLILCLSVFIICLPTNSPIMSWAPTISINIKKASKPIDCFNNSINSVTMYTWHPRRLQPNRLFSEE